MCSFDSWAACYTSSPLPRIKIVTAATTAAAAAGGGGATDITPLPFASILFLWLKAIWAFSWKVILNQFLVPFFFTLSDNGRTLLVNKPFRVSIIQA